MQQEFDTMGGVLDLPRKGCRREAHGLAEEPYRPETDACLVVEQRERYPFAVFSCSGHSLDGAI